MQIGYGPEKFSSLIGWAFFGMRSLLPDEGPQSFSQFIPRMPKGSEPLFFAAVIRGRVFDAPMNAPGLGREDGTGFPRIVADSDNVIEVLRQEIFH